jgi:hypothetical protein
VFALVKAAGRVAQSYKETSLGFRTHQFIQLDILIKPSWQTLGVEGPSANHDRRGSARISLGRRFVAEDRKGLIPDKPCRASGSRARVVSIPPQSSRYARCVPLTAAEPVVPMRHSHSASRASNLLHSTHISPKCVGRGPGVMGMVAVAPGKAFVLGLLKKGRKSGNNEVNKSNVETPWSTN